MEKNIEIDFSVDAPEWVDEWHKNIRMDGRWIDRDRQTMKMEQTKEKKNNIRNTDIRWTICWNK